MVIAGTQETTLQEIAKYAGIGVDYFTVSFVDVESLQIFAEQIIPKFQHQ
jgi:alkanesulfonate monooxygenase SsuD/methylene tetrahydromethanopterin reductase-like flavin-dependent oxidoreductase (luciferase family)